MRGFPHYNGFFLPLFAIVDAGFMPSRTQLLPGTSYVQTGSDSNQVLWASGQQSKCKNVNVQLINVCILPRQSHWIENHGSVGQSVGKVCTALYRAARAAKKMSALSYFSV